MPPYKRHPLVENILGPYRPRPTLFPERQAPTAAPQVLSEPPPLLRARSKPTLFPERQVGGVRSLLQDPDERSFGERAWDYGKDTAISLLGKGVVGVGEAVVGLGNIATLGAAGRGWEALGYDPKATQDYFDSLQSPELRAARERVAEADGFIPTIKASLRNPSTIAQGIVESFPSMLAGGALGKGAIALGSRVAPKLAATLAPAAGAIGEGMAAAGSAAEQIRQETGGLTPTQAALAVTSGGVTGLLGRVIGKTANRFGIDDIDALAAGLPAGVRKNALGRVLGAAGGAVSEGAEELTQSAQEQIQHNLAVGRPWDEGVANASAAGTLMGSAMGVGANLVSGRKASPTLKDLIGAESSPLDSKGLTKATAGLPPAAPGGIPDDDDTLGQALRPRRPPGGGPPGATADPTIVAFVLEAEANGKDGAKALAENGLKPEEVKAVMAAVQTQHGTKAQRTKATKDQTRVETLDAKVDAREAARRAPAEPEFDREFGGINPQVLAAEVARSRPQSATREQAARYQEDALRAVEEAELEQPAGPIEPDLDARSEIQKTAEDYVYRDLLAEAGKRHNEARAGAEVALDAQQMAPALERAEKWKAQRDQIAAAGGPDFRLAPFIDTLIAQSVDAKSIKPLADALASENVPISKSKLATIVERAALADGIESPAEADRPAEGELPATRTPESLSAVPAQADGGVSVPVPTDREVEEGVDGVHEESVTRPKVVVRNTPYSVEQTEDGVFLKGKRGAKYRLVKSVDDPSKWQVENERRGILGAEFGELGTLRGVRFSIENGEVKVASATPRGVKQNENPERAHPDKGRELAEALGQVQPEGGKPVSGVAALLAKNETPVTPDAQIGQAEPKAALQGAEAGGVAQDGDVPAAGRADGAQGVESLNQRPGLSAQVDARRDRGKGEPSALAIPDQKGVGENPVALGATDSARGVVPAEGAGIGTGRDSVVADNAPQGGEIVARGQPESREAAEHLRPLRERVAELSRKIRTTRSKADAKRFTKMRANTQKKLEAVEKDIQARGESVVIEAAKSRQRKNAEATKVRRAKVEAEKAQPYQRNESYPAEAEMSDRDVEIIDGTAVQLLRDLNKAPGRGVAHNLLAYLQNTGIRPQDLSDRWGISFKDLSPEMKKTVKRDAPAWDHLAEERFVEDGWIPENETDKSAMFDDLVGRVLAGEDVAHPENIEAGGEGARAAVDAITNRVGASVVAVREALRKGGGNPLEMKVRKALREVDPYSAFEQADASTSAEKRRLKDTPKKRALDAIIEVLRGKNLEGVSDLGEDYVEATSASISAKWDAAIKAGQSPIEIGGTPETRDFRGISVIGHDGKVLIRAGLAGAIVDTVTGEINIAAPEDARVAGGRVVRYVLLAIADGRVPEATRNPMSDDMIRALAGELFRNKIDAEAIIGLDMDKIFGMLRTDGSPRRSERPREASPQALDSTRARIDDTGPGGPGGRDTEGDARGGDAPVGPDGAESASRAQAADGGKLDGLDKGPEQASGVDEEPSFLKAQNAPKDFGKPAKKQFNRDKSGQGLLPGDITFAGANVETRVTPDKTAAQEARDAEEAENAKREDAKRQRSIGDEEADAKPTPKLGDYVSWREPAIVYKDGKPVEDATKKVSGQLISAKDAKFEIKRTDGGYETRALSDVEFERPGELTDRQKAATAPVTSDVDLKESIKDLFQERIGQVPHIYQKGYEKDVSIHYDPTAPLKYRTYFVQDTRYEDPNRGSPDTKFPKLLLKTRDREKARQFLREYNEKHGVKKEQPVEAKPEAKKPEGPKYATRAKAEPERDLIIQHNISATKLIQSDKMGGLSVPSFAVTKAESPLTGFGEIMLLGNRDLADPAKSGMKVFGGDIYSPRYPNLRYKFHSVGAIAKTLEEGNRALGTHLDEDALQKGGASELGLGSPAMAWTFLKSKGITPDIKRDDVPPERLEKMKAAGLGPWLGVARYNIENHGGGQAAFDKAALKLYSEYGTREDETHEERAAWLKRLTEDQKANLVRRIAWETEKAGKGEIYLPGTRDALREQIQKAGLEEEFDAFAARVVESGRPETRINKGYTDSGRARTIPHTLENVVAEMKKSLRGGEGGSYGPGMVRAAVTPQFTSLKAIREAKGRLIPKAEMDALKEEISTDFWAVANLIPSNRDFGHGDAVVSMMMDSVKMGLDRAAKEYGWTLQDGTKQKIREFMDKLRTVPTEYFEAKLPRAVEIQEFSAAVVPTDVDPKVLAVLERHGVPVHTYTRGDAKSRTDAIGKATESEGMRFKTQDASKVKVSKPLTIERVRYAMPGLRWETQKDGSFTAPLSGGRTVRVVPNAQFIEVDEGAKAASDAARGASGPSDVVGSTSPMNRITKEILVRLSENTDVKVEVHEGLHVLFPIAFTENETKALLKEFGTEEDVAYKIADWWVKPESKTWYGKLFQRLKRLVQRIGHFFKPTWESTFEEVKSGRVAQRVAPGSDRKDGASAGSKLATAFHGSPHTFDKFKFDEKTVGTGEGMQSYGHGLYFAENQAIGEQYRKALSGMDVSLDGKPVQNPSFGPSVEGSALNAVKHMGGVTQAINLYLDNLSDVNNSKDESTKHWRDILAWLRENRARIEAIPAGNLYRVDIPDSVVDKMLDWDKPLSEQQPEVSAAVRSAILPARLEVFGNDVRYGMLGKEVYERVFGGKETASKRLLAAGIPGIKYLDGNSRNTGSFSVRNRAGVLMAGPFATRQAAQTYAQRQTDRDSLSVTRDDGGSRNFVVFDDRDVTILDRNGVKVKGEEKIDAISDLQAQHPETSETGAKAATRDVPVNDETVIPEDSEPFVFRFIRHTEKAPRFGARFGQDVEPAGRYMMIGTSGMVVQKGQETGVVSFKRPLVLPAGEGYGEPTNWKNVISQRFRGLTGRKLSQAIRNAGYDGIVTVNSSRGENRPAHTSEIVDLTGFTPENPDIRYATAPKIAPIPTGPKSLVGKETKAQLIQRKVQDRLNHLTLTEMASKALRGDKSEPELANKFYRTQPDIQYVLDGAKLAIIDPLIAFIKESGLNHELLGKAMNGDADAKAKMEQSGKAKTYAEAIQRIRDIHGVADRMREIGGLVDTDDEAAAKRIDRAEKKDSKVHSLDRALDDLEKAVVAVEMNKAKDALAVFTEKAGPDFGIVRKAKAEKGEVRDDEKPTIPFKRDGVAWEIVLADTATTEAVNKLDQDKLNELLQGISHATRWVSRVNTLWSPAFLVKNKIRDAASATITSWILGGTPKGLTKSAAWDVAFGQRAAWRGTREFMANPRGQFEKGSNAWWAQQAHKHAAVPGYFKQIDTIKQTESRLADALKGAKADKVSLRHTYDVMMAFSAASEASTRVSVFRAFVEAGMSPEKAGNAARATLDVNKTGELTRQIGAVLPFFNSAVQGTARLGQLLTHSDPGVKKRAWQAAGAMVAAGAVVGMALAGWGGDDDEDEIPDSDQMPEWDTQRNLIIGGVKWPLPQGFSALVYAGFAFSKMARGRMKPADFALQTSIAFRDQFVPISSPAGVFQPLVDIASNKKFSGAPIHPTRYPGDTAPDSSKAFRGTSGAAKAIAKGLNRLSGGDEAEAGMLDVYPGTIDYAMQSMGGALGRFMFDTYRASEALVKGQPVKKIPVIGDFLVDKERNIQSRFFEAARELDDIHALQNRKEKLVLSQQLKELFPDAQVEGATLTELRKAMKESGSSVSPDRIAWARKEMERLDGKRLRARETFREATKALKVLDETPDGPAKDAKKLEIMTKANQIWAKAGR